MPSRRWMMLRAALVGSALFAAACGGAQEEPAGQSPAGAEPTKTAKIAFISPLTGSLSALGVGMKNSVDLAIKQANEDRKVSGWKLQLLALDDAGDATQGANVARQAAADPAVVALIGTLNSSVAQAVQPIVNAQNIAMVSPANTNPTLTMGQDFATAPKRPFKTYFRVVTRDDIQGPFGADYAYNQLKKRKAAIIHDKKTYGQGLARAFADAFKKLGGQTLTEETVNPGDRDFRAVLTKIKGQNPDMIYYGGEYPEGGPLCKQAGEVGMKAADVPIMGGDGMEDDQLISACADNAEGNYVTFVGAPAEKLEAAQAFLDDYKAAKYKDGFSAYGHIAYESANLIISALSNVLPSETAITPAARTKVVDAIQKVRYQGILGTTTFDQNGDTTNRVLRVDKVTSGKFDAVFVGRFEAGKVTEL